jgi:RNA polymerase sigma factor (TIGR02999 family)
MSDSSQIVELLDKASAGDKDAEAELLPYVYADLHAIAAKYLYRERPNHTLQATALVHEAYLRLIGRREPVAWRGRTHFFATSAQLMRRILTDYARQTKAAKRGGGTPKLVLEDSLVVGSYQCEMLDDLDDALKRLAAFAPRQAQVVEMRFFAGMTEEQIAEKLQVSGRTVKRDWSVAKAWLYGDLRRNE